MRNNNALHIAAKGGDLVEVQSQVGNFDINAKGEEGRTALYWSAREGHAEIVKLLLTFSPEVNATDVSTLSLKLIYLIRISPIHYPSFISFFLHLSTYIVITLTLLSRLVVTTSYTQYPILLLVVVLSIDLFIALSTYPPTHVIFLLFLTIFLTVDTHSRSVVLITHDPLTLVVILSPLCRLY